MTWALNVTHEVRREFAEAQRFARGIFPRVGEDAKPIESLPPRPIMITVRRRIVTRRDAA